MIVNSASAGASVSGASKMERVGMSASLMITSALRFNSLTVYPSLVVGSSSSTKITPSFSSRLFRDLKGKLRTDECTPEFSVKSRLVVIDSLEAAIVLSRKFPLI